MIKFNKKKKRQMTQWYNNNKNLKPYFNKRKKLITIPNKYLKYGYIRVWKKKYRRNNRRWKRKWYHTKLNKFEVKEVTDVILDNFSYPNNYIKRKINKNKKNWKKNILLTTSKLKFYFNNLNMPWKYFFIPSTPISNKIKFLLYKFNKKLGIEKKYRINFLKGLKGYLLKMAFIQKRKYLLLDAISPDWEEITAYIKQKYKKKWRYFYQKSVHDWNKIISNYTLFFFIAQIYQFNLKKTSIKFKQPLKQTKFENNYMEQTAYPWRDALMFKRYLYKRKWFTKIKRKLHFELKPYYRVKEPRFEKKNRLFWWLSTLLLKNKDIQREIWKNKRLRIKQLLLRLSLSFYGQISFKQFNYLNEKAKKIKSTQLNKYSILLSKLELRIDILVYRLNLAPSLFWARELVRSGQIYVYNLQKSKDWISMYKNLWKISFPLRLRDPKNLYCNNKGLKIWFLSQTKIFLSPIWNYNYIMKTGDLLYNSPTSRINKFYFNKELFKKPVPSHLMTHYESQLKWDPRTKKPVVYSLLKWEQQYLHPLSSVILFTPKFDDLPKLDRINKEYTQWIVL